MATDNIFYDESPATFEHVMPRPAKAKKLEAWEMVTVKQTALKESDIRERKQDFAWWTFG